MRSDHTFGIDFIVRACQPGSKDGYIYAKISVDNGAPAELSIKEKIRMSDWDWKKGKVGGTTVAVKTINQYMDDVREKIKAKYRELIFAQQVVTAQSVKAAYLDVQSGLKRHTCKELLAYFERIWEKKLKASNMKNYYTTIEYVKLFLESKSPETGKMLFPEKDVYLSQITMEFATNLEYYIANNPIKLQDPCKGNGLAKHMQRFKRIMKWCSEVGWLKPNPIAEFRPWVRKYRRRRKLTIEQVFELEMLQGLSPRMEYVRDLFMFSCYSGLAFVDALAISPQHIEKMDDGTIWCKIHRQKSEELAAVPFLSKACELINKYWEKGKAVTGGPIFPKISNSYINELLKILQGMIGVDFDLTYHISRHTFAKTVALKFKVPIHVVQIMLGHLKISTTMIYVEVDEEMVSESTEGWEERLEERKGLYIAHKTTSLSEDQKKQKVS